MFNHLGNPAAAPFSQAVPQQPPSGGQSAPHGHQQVQRTQQQSQPPFYALQQFAPQHQHQSQTQRSSPASSNPAFGSPAPHESDKDKDKDKGSGKEVAKRQHEDGPASSTGGHDDGPDKKKLAMSCADCRRRKVKCSRTIPCLACIKRGVSHLCSFDDAKIDPSPQPFALASDLTRVHDRLARMEAFLQTLPAEFRKDAPNFLIMPPSPPPEAPRRRPRKSKTALTEDGHEDEEMHSIKSEEPVSDTEDAAATLEEVAFGRHASFRSANFTGSSHARPMGASYTEQGGAGTGGMESGTMPFPGMGRYELTASNTSIVGPEIDTDDFTFSAPMSLSLTASDSEVRTARKQMLDSIFSVLPDKSRSYFLVEKYQANCSWLFRVTSQQCFHSELDRFWEMVEAGRQGEVDPLWLAVYTAKLALGLDSCAIDQLPSNTWTADDLLTIPAVYTRASRRCLLLGDWAGVPRVRSVQAIILQGQFFHSSSKGDKGARFMVWLAGAVRICHMLGLHRLGSNPETMPPDDPALPIGVNSTKREICLKVWAHTKFMDWMSASSRLRGYLVNPEQDDSAMPSNVNMEDLSLTEWKLHPYPSSTLTDASFDIMKVRLATQLRLAFDRLVNNPEEFSYDTVLELDRGYRELINHLPDVWVKSSVENESQPKLQWMRGVARTGLHSRIVRLHRPFLSRGYAKSSKYRYSNEQCLASAAYVIEAQHQLKAELSALAWFTFGHVLGSAIVLFNDLFHAIDTDAPTAEIEAKKVVLQKAYEVFQRPISKMSLQVMVQQGAKILSGLFMEQEKRQAARAAHALVPGSAPAGKSESFAQILLRMSKHIGMVKPADRPVPAPSTSTMPVISSQAAMSTANFPDLSTVQTSGFDFYGAGAGGLSFPANSGMLNAGNGFAMTDASQFQFFQELGMLGGGQDVWTNPAFATHSSGSSKNSNSPPDISVLANSIAYNGDMFGFGQPTNNGSYGQKWDTDIFGSLN